MSKKVKILCIHGLGDHRNSTWKEGWPRAIKEVFPAEDDIELEFDFVTYDDIFEKTKIDAWEAAEALWKLTASGVGSIGRKRGALGNVSKKIRWTAGYVVAWLEDEAFQDRTRARLLDRIADFGPDIVIAHSLGSLISYQAFNHADADVEPIASALSKIRFVSIGSQLANPFVVRNVSSGRLTSPPTQLWRHFYNKHDDVFTAPIRLFESYDFEQIETPFDTPGVGDHSAEEYLKHPNAVEEFWRPLAEETLSPRSFGPATRQFSTLPPSKRAPASRKSRKRKRALLVGIDDYPNPRDKLSGCVNDVFLMSSVLQECGFEANEIRTCLDSRATREGILERFEWLLDDPQPEDERIFYFAAHGARIPTYGENMEPDHFEEILVPYDFDWSKETAIRDADLVPLYSQLPFSTRFGMIFDCCNGGVDGTQDTRSGGPAIRSITLPDDIRHRELKWDLEAQMWVPRDFKRMDKGFARSKKDREAYFGTNGCTARLGRATSLRGLDSTEYSKLKKSSGDDPIGPYLPMILQACDDDQLAAEYRHGVTTYGAFTYSLSSLLRRRGAQGGVTYVSLVDETKAQLKDLGYDQVPQVMGPSSVLNENIPWFI